MFLYIRKSFMVFKIVLASVALLTAMIDLLGTPQNSFLLTQDIGKQLGVVMALVFGIITIVEAFMAPPGAVVSNKLFSNWKSGAHVPILGMQKAAEEAAV